MKATTDIRQDLNTTLAIYQQLSGLSTKDVLEKQGGKLGFAIRRSLKGIAPKKGSIRADLEGRLRSGSGIRVRKAAREYASARTVATATNLRTGLGAKFLEATARGNVKANGRNWWQIAVQREIAIREGGRGFLAYSAKYPTVLKDQQRAVSRYGPTLSEAGVTLTGVNKYARFEWSGAGSRLAESAEEGLAKQRAQAAVDAAVQSVRDDIMVYVRRKQQQVVDAAMRTVRRMAA